jgi:hypothetical protein
MGDKSPKSKSKDNKQKQAKGAAADKAKKRAIANKENKTDKKK